MLLKIRQNSGAETQNRTDFSEVSMEMNVSTNDESNPVPAHLNEPEGLILFIKNIFLDINT